MRQAPIRTRQLAAQLNRKGRSRLLGGASALAAAAMLLLAPHQAAAQVAVTGRAFEAIPTANPDFSITRSDTQDVVRIFNSSTVINWRPVDIATSSAVIDILPTGNTLAFTGDANFTVLNRVIPDDPTRAIQFNGGVVSLVGGALGGNVWFYSPGGIIAGPSSVFLVGGLVLTSSNMTGIGASGTQMNFLGANAGSRVEIQPGAQLLSSNYVVLWAPRVVQSGGVGAGGNISYVGAEQGTLTVTGGLFNMVIDVGTDDPNGVVHTGISTGGTPVNNPVRAITMATVAKNDFVNMLVGGAVGYADATVATAGNGIIVLSAANGAQPNSGNITIGPAVLNSTTLATASGDLTIALNGQSQALTIGSATNEADFFGLAGRNLTINATSGATVNAADNFFAQAAAPGQGGVLTVNIDDAGRDNDSSFSGLLVGGNLTLSAFGNGVDNIPVSPLAVAVSPTFGGDGNGGTIGVNVSQGGELIVGGTTLFSAAGTAGVGGLFSGDATGGAINFTLNGNNSRVQFVGNALFDVSANRSAPGAVNAGGSVAAGSINLALNAGSFTFADLTLTANADADDSINATGRFNGAAGGTINLTNTARITGTTLTANALGIGGDGGTSPAVSDAGGDGSGGAVSLTNGVGGSLTLQALGVNVSGTGGEGGRGDVLVNGARGGSGFGGDIAVSNADTLAGTPTLTLSAAGTGGNGGTGGASLDDVNPGANGGAAGSGFGGAIDLIANGATTAVQINSLIGAAGTGGTGGIGGEARFFESGNGGAGGVGQGGDIALVSTAGGSLEITAGTGTLTLDSGGAGGAGGNEGFGLNPVGNPGQNGASAGGTVELLATGGALTVTGNLVADASATGNQDLRPGATGADATGGTITTNVSGGGDLTTTGGLWLNASAIAAIGNVSAGTGRGGTVDMLMSGAGSSFNVQGQFPLFFANPPRGRAIYVDTSAYEPQSGNPLLQTATGGDTFGGAINLAFTGGNSTINGRTELRNFSAALNPLSGVGPGPQLFLNNATATGGTIDIALSNGTHTWGSLDGSVTTFGLGGSAVNGTVRATLDNATLNLIATPGGNGRLNLSTYVAGEISQSDPDAVILRVLNGSTLTANGGIALFADAGHGVSTNTITTGNVVLEVDASTVSVATNTIFLGNEAQAFRFPGAVTNTTGAGARAGDLSFSAANGSTITGDVEMSSFATADSGPSGGTGRSGAITYVLDGSTHTGSLDLLSFAEGLGATDVGGTAGQAIAGNQSISILNSALFTGDVQLETLALTYYAGAASGALGDMDSGTLNLRVDNSTADIGVLSVVNNVLASVAADGFAGSNARGPDVNLTVTGSVVDIGDATITLDALGGRGGRDANGGSGTGGQLRISSDATSTLTINDAGFSSVGTAGDGGDADFTGSGAGGTGAGGVVEITSAGSLSINTLNAVTSGVGGRGGFGGGGSGFFAGGAGGAGLGGQILLTSLGDLTLPFFAGTAIGSGGLGGGADGGEVGGDGGFGQGGQVGLEFSAAPGIVLNLGNVALDSSALGGGGGAGGIGVSSGDGGVGGSGGSAAGGISRFRVTGAGASVDFDPFLFNLASTALGGNGGAGGGNFAGGTAGAGGDGGAATGGTIALEAGSNAELTLLQVSAGPFQFSVSGTGGAGGSGGAIDMINGGTAGAGGDGGNGTGGSPTLRAVGGLITVGDIEIRATGIGGSGGTGGTDGTVTLGADGNGGNGFGGKPLLETLDGSPGRLTLGTVVIDAGGIGGGGTLTGLTGGGQITITDASADPAGLITMGSLTVTAGGPLTPPGTPSLTIEGNSGPITVTGDVSATVAGDINFLFDGTGRLAAGGSTTLDAGGNIALTHSGNATGAVSLNTGTDLIATAGGNFGAGAGSIINAGRDVSITAQNIQFASIAAVRDLLLTATNGNITGVGAAGLAGGRVLDLDATQAIVVGDIESDLSIALTAGTSVTAGNLTSIGTDTLGDERIDIVAGGDVSLGTVDAIDALTITGAGLTATALDGQSVTATMTGVIDVGAASSETTIALSGTAITLDNGDAAGNITLDSSAGGIVLGTVNSETDLLATATGDITFTTLTGRVVTLNSGGDITGGIAAADRDVTSGVSRNVNLTAVGDIAITGAAAIDNVVVRGASLTATGAVTSGTAINDNIDVLVSGAIDIGSTSSGGQTVLTGASITLGSGVAGLGTSVLTATTGAVDIGTFDSEEFLDIVSATTVDFVTLTARALSIDAVGDVTGTRAAADLALASGRPRDVSVTTDGAIDIDQLAAVDSVVMRGASLASTSIVSGTGLNANIDVLVGGAIDIGSTSSGGQTVLTGSTVTLDTGVAGAGASVLTSTVGDVTLGTFDSENFLDIVSAGSVGFDTLTARALSIDAQSDVIGTRAAADVNLASGRPRNVTISAGNSVAVDRISAVDDIIIDAFTLNTLDVSAQGNLVATLVQVGNLTSITTGGDATVTGSSLAIGDGVSGGNALLTATVVDVDLGTWDAQGFLDIDAVGAVNFDRVTGRLVEVIAGGAITGNFAASDVALASGRPRNVTLDAGGAVSIGEVRSIGAVLLDGTAIDAGIVNAAGTVTATGTGAVAIDSLTAGTNATVQGASVALIDGTVGGFLRGNATGGNLGITGTLTVTGNIDLDATGDIGFGTLASTTGVLDARAGGGITFTSAASPVNVTLIAGGLINGGTISGRDAVVTGGSVDLDDVTMTGLVTLTSTLGDLVAGNVSSTNVSINATSARALRLGDVTAAGNVVLGSTGATTVGNVNAGSQVTFNTGGDLTALDIVGSGTVPGLDINVGGNAQFGSVTSGGLIDIDVTGNLAGGVLQAAGTLTVDAASIAITSANSDAFGIALRSTVGGVMADLLTAAGSVQVSSATGATLGTLDAGANIDVTAGGNTTLGGATAAGNLTVTVTGNLGSGALAAGASPASILDLNVTGDAQVTSAQSGLILDVDVGGALTGGNFASGATTVDAGSINVTRIAGTAGGGVLANATTGNALIGTVDSGGNARVNALAGSANVGTLNATLLGEVIARSVTLNTGTIGGNLRLQATAGNVAGTGVIDVAGAIDLDATGNIGFGTLAARGGALTADAGGDITFTRASALGSLTLAAGGGVSGGDISGNFVTIGAGTNALIGNVTAGGRTSITAGGLATFISITSQLSVGIRAAEIFGGDISTPFAGGDNIIDLAATGELTVGNITSGESTSLVAGGALVAGTIRNIATDGGALLVRGNGVTADAISTPLAGGGGITVDGGTGAVTIGSFAAGNASTIAGASLALGPVDVRGSLGLIATNGSILANRGIAVTGGLNARATGNIALSTLTSGGRTLLDADGSVSFDDITSQLSVTIDAASITGGDITTPFAAGDNIVALTTTGDMTLGDVSSGETTTLTAGGALVAGTIRATATDGATITIQSQGARIGALIGEVAGGGTISLDGGAGAVDLGTLVSGSNAIVTGESIALASGDIRGSLSLTSTLGDIALAPDGASQIRVGRSTTLTSGRSILLTHTNNTGRIVSLASAGNIVAQAETGIIGAAGSALSGNEVFIFAGRDVDLADVRAIPALVITAGGSVTLTNATVTGPQGLSNLSGIAIDAGLNPGGGSTYDNNGNVRLTGTIQSYSGIGINAGGRVEFAPGSQTLAGNRIAVRTGDDIIVGAGALLQSARDATLVIDPATPFASAGAIDLQAGGLTPLSSTPLTPIASLVVDGSINAGRGAVIARANAIDGIDGAFAGSSLSFDIDNAPVAGAVLSDDNGLLTAPCLEGNVCLGSIAASNQLLVGQASPDDVLSLTIEQGTVNAREIRIATRNDIVMGTSGIATTLNATDLFTASSRAGDVDLRDATIVSDLIRIEAAGSLLGSASLTSIGDVGVTVGDSLFARSIVAGGELTTAAGAGEVLEGRFSVPGTLAVGTLSLGAGVVDYTAGAIDIGQLTVPGTQARLVATGALSLGQTTGATSLDLQGGSVAGGDLSASGNIAIRSGGDVDLVSAAAGGSISLDLPGNLTFTGLRADGDITATAGGAANGGDLDAQGVVTLDAARIVIGSASGSTLSLTSATDVRFDALTSPNSIAITAAAGTIGGNTTAGLIETGGDLTLRARAIDLRDLAAGGAIDIAVTGTVLTLGRLDAGTDIVLGSAGSILVDHAEAAGDFTATSALGFATGPNSIVTGGDIVINAGGPAVLGNSIAGGLIDVNASQIDFASLVAGTTIELTTIPAFATAGGTGNITGGSIQAGAGTSSLVTTAGNIALTGPALVGGDLFMTANGGTVALGGQTTANGLLRVGATTTITAGNLASSTGDVIAEAAQGITLANASAANDVRLLATAGSVAFANLGGRDISVSAANNVSGTTITAGRDGDLQADRDGSGAGDLALSGLARAVRNLNLYGANVTLANVAVTGVVPAPAGRLSGFVTINSTNGNVQVGDVTAPGMTIVAEGGNLVAGNLDAFDPVLAFGLPTIIDLSAFGGDITVGSLTTVGDVAIFNDGGALTRVLGTTTVGNDLFFSGSGQFRFDGAVTTGRDVDGLADDAVAGGVVFGTGLAAGRNVRVVAANGAIAMLPGASSPSVIDGNLTLTARDLTLGVVDVGGDLALTASAGSLDASDVGRVGGSIALVAGSDVTFGALAAGGSSFTVNAGRAIAFDAAGSGGSIGMTAAGTLTGGDLTAPGTISLDAARIAIGDATAGSFALTSRSDLLFNSVTSASAITLTAADGRIGANGGPGNLTSDGSVALLARTIALGTIDAAGAVTGRSTAGDMTVARLLSGGDIALTSAGSIAVDHAEATGDFTATADGAFATGPNSILTGGDIVIDADGPVTLGNSSAGGLVDVRGSQIDFAALAAGQTVALLTEPSRQTGFGNGNITGTSLTAGAGTSTVNATFGSVTLSGQTSVAGALTLTAEGGITLGTVGVQGGDLAATAGGAIALGSATASGNARLTAGSGINASGDIAVGGTLDLIAQAGAIAARDLTAGTVNATASGNIGLRDVVLSGGAASLVSGGAMALRDVTGAGAAGVSITADGNLGFDDIVTTGNVAVRSGNGAVAGTRVDAGGNASIESAAGLTFDRIAAGGAVSLQSTGSGAIAGGDIEAGTTVSASTGGTFTAGQIAAGRSGSGLIDIAAAQGITIARLLGSGAVLAAADGRIAVTGDINVAGFVSAVGRSVLLRSSHALATSATATAGDIDIESSGNLDATAVARGGNIRLVSTAGNVIAADVSAAEASPGTGGNVVIDAFGTLRVEDNVVAANRLEMAARGLADIRASAVGRDITLRASNVAIGSAGSLGTLAGTRSIAISGGGIARIGGADGATPGFVIDNAEFARIRASGSIAISASTAIILDTLDIRVASGTTADGNLRGEGRLDFAAAEGIDIVGEVIMTGATADNAIGLTTRGDVFLDASTGLLEINDGAGNYLGLIEIEAMNFHAMTEQARTDIQAATSIDAIDDRLAQNDGIDNPDGLIRTGTLDIATIASDVFIQNTAAGTAFADRRGFTVDELLIADRNGTNQPIVINGIIAGATGVDAVTLAQISSTFDPGSTINGCLIANPAGCIQLPEVLRGVAFPVQDLIETELEDDAPGEPGIGAGVVDAPLIDLRDPLDTSEDPLLDDPVTGAGNEDLWVGEQPGE